MPLTWFWRCVAVRTGLPTVMIPENSKSVASIVTEVPPPPDVCVHVNVVFVPEEIDAAFWQKNI